MPRSLMLALVAALLLVAAPASAAPPPLPSGKVTPAASPTAASTIDLAALTLAPTDLPGYGLESSRRYSVADFVDTADDNTGAAMKQAGMIGGYESDLILADAAGHLTSQLMTTVNLFGDANGAKQGYSAFARRDVANLTVVANPPAVGDETSYYADTATDSQTNTTLHQRIVLFRTGRVVAYVFLRPRDGSTPEVGAVAAFGRSLLDKIAAGLAKPGPNLGARLTLLKQDYSLTKVDAYWRIEGLDQRNWSDTDAARDQRLAPFFDATSVYAVTQQLADQESLPALSWRAASFADEAAAKTWFDHYLSLVAGTAGMTMTPAAGAATFGDQSAAVSYQFKTGSGAMAHSLLIVARFGALGVVERIDASAAVPLDAAEPLMTAEAACVAGPAACPAASIPSALAALAGG